MRDGADQIGDHVIRKEIERSVSNVADHDTRHTAATWMAKKVDVLDLCRQFGWSNPKMALLYFNPTASDISKRLSVRIAQNPQIR